MKRKTFITCLSSAGLFIPMSIQSNHNRIGIDDKSISKYIPIENYSINDINPPLPDGKRSPFGWDYFEIPVTGKKVIFTVHQLPSNYKGKVFLRLLIALEVRDKREIGVYLARSGTLIGRLSVWYANSLQLFECELKVNSDKIKKEGIALKLLEGGESLFCYTFTKETGSHIYLDMGYQKDLSEKFIESLCSIRSVHPFGWMGGCVTDALEALAKSGRFPQAQDTLQQHLRLFLPDDHNLIYEDNFGYPQDNKYKSPERGLPFASIVNIYPDHPSIKLFTDYCEKWNNGNQSLFETLATEGCYLLAYPLAAISKVKQNNSWCNIALVELIERIEFLTVEDAVFQILSKKNNVRRGRNWARGYAWFLMGLVRSYEVIDNIRAFKRDPRMFKIREAFEYYADLALKHQQKDAGWAAYIDIPETGFDASGTAGIASALKYAHQLGWNVDFDRKKQTAVIERLENSLTSDGFLKDNCQVNRGGEELQKSGYRVISQYAMGLMAHLYV